MIIQVIHHRKVTTVDTSVFTHLEPNFFCQLRADVVVWIKINLRSVVQYLHYVNYYGRAARRNLLINSYSAEKAIDKLLECWSIVTISYEFLFVHFS